ncbi:hypothetical protein [Synechococcus phage MinM1]|nr:hypothetical protein [Synechococcus phage MinM1]
MKIADLLRLAEARLATLNGAHTTASRAGDTQRVAQIDAEIAEMTATLAALRTLTE